MNRAERRKKEKYLKKKLTDEQFAQLRQRVIDESVEIKVSRMWNIMSGELIRIMRQNRISEERVSKICTEFHDVMIKKFGEERNHEGLSQCGRKKPDYGNDVTAGDNQRE